MTLPYHWPVLSPVQIDQDLNGTRLGVTPDPLIAYATKAEAVKAAIEYAAENNHATDASGGNAFAAPLKVTQRGDTLSLKTSGVWNTISPHDKTYIYRLNSDNVSESWQLTHEGSLQYFTDGVTEYEDVEHNTLSHFIKELGLTIR